MYIVGTKYVTIFVTLVTVVDCIGLMLFYGGITNLTYPRLQSGIIVLQLPLMYYFTKLIYQSIRLECFEKKNIHKNINNKYRR